jgi:hypothetical protein
VKSAQSSEVYSDLVIFVKTREKSFIANNVINSVSERSDSLSTKLLERNEKLQKYESELDAMQKELATMKTDAKRTTNELEARILKCTKKLVLLIEPAGEGSEETRLDQVLAHVAKTRIKKLITARRELNLILHFSRHTRQWESPAREQLDNNSVVFCDGKSNGCVSSGNNKYPMPIKMCARFIELFALFSPVLIHKSTVIFSTSSSCSSSSNPVSNAKAD